MARTLDWIIRHDPVIAAATITDIIGEAERRGIPRHVSARSIRTALGLDSKLDAAARREFLDRVLSQLSAASEQRAARGRSTHAAERGPWKDAIMADVYRTKAATALPAPKKPCNR